MTERRWEPVRHQVVIGGRVVDGKTKRPVSGALVALTAMPETFKVRCAASIVAASQLGARGATRLDQTRTSAAGYYYFLDLPAGPYELKATGLGRIPPVGTGRAKVPLDQTGNVAMATVDLVLRSY
jgi:hypothetical protein